MLKKLGKSIVILFVLAGVLSPYVFGVQKGNTITLEKRQVSADLGPVPGLFDATLIIPTSSTSSASAVVRVEVKAKVQDAFKTFLTLPGGFKSFVIQISQKADFSDLEVEDDIGTTYWYTGEYTNDANKTRVYQKVFGGLDPSTSYYVRFAVYEGIGTKTYVDLAKNQFTTTAQGTGPAVQGTSGGTYSENPMPDCDFDTISGCFAQILYYALFVPTSWVIWCAGRLLDFGVAYSIQSGSYSGTSFVTEGWKLVRDISNIFFILVLIYTGISIMLDLDNDAKKKISTVVIVAVMINFSLFFSKVIIDAGNIVAKTLYYNIQPKDKTGKDIDPTIIGSYSVKPLSAVLVDKYNPQQILLQVNSKNIAYEDGDLIAGQQNSSSDFGTGSFILVVLLAVALNIIGAYVFFVAAFLFIGRVIGLWFAMIFAPLAFISYTLPSKASGKLGSFGHDKWWSELISLSFMAPVFIFFMYLIILFLDTDFLNFKTSLVNTGGSLFLLMSVIIPFIFIAIMLLKAKKIAKDMSGEIAGQLVGFAEKAGGMLTGVGVGALTGGAALLGRNTIGKGFSSMANNEETKAKAAAGDRFAQAKLSLANMGSKWSFDARKTPGMDALAKNKELSNIKSPKWMGFNAQIPVLGRIDTKTEGGFNGRVERSKKEELEKAESYKMKGPAADVQNMKAKKWNDDYESAKNDTIGWYATQKDKTFDENDFRKQYEAGIATKYTKNAAGKWEPEAGVAVGTRKVLNATEENAQRMRDEADAVEYGKGYVDEKKRAKEGYIQKAGEWAATPKDKDGKRKDAAGIEIPEPKFDEEKIKAAYLAKNPEYEKERDAAKDRAIQENKSFDEKIWREEEYFHDRMDKAKAELVSTLRKQAGDEVKDIKSYTSKEINIANKNLKKATGELGKVEQHMEDIVRLFNNKVSNPKGTQTITLDELTDSTQVEPAINFQEQQLGKLRVDLKVKQNEIREKTKQGIPITKAEKSAFARISSNIEKKERTINEYKKIFENKEKYEKNKDEATKILNSQK